MEAIAESGTCTAQKERGEHNRQRPYIFDLLLLSPFVLLFLLQLFRHEMWRDELNAWGVALASPNVSSLFRKLHYEAHPGFWYLLLWSVSRFTPDPFAMKVLEALIGIGTYVLLGLFAPFSRVEKILLFLSYFVSFEYTVLTRNYSLCFLLVLVYLYNRSKYPDRVLSNAALLGAIANCDMIGIILSASLFVEYTKYRLALSRGRNHLYWAILAYSCLLIFAVASLVPAPDISWRTTGHILGNRCEPIHFVYAVLNYLVVTWFPISTGFPLHFWNPSAGDHLSFYLAALPFVTAGLFLIFRRTARCFAVFGIAALGAIVFGALFYMGTVRHFGIVFMAFLAALWIQRTSGMRPSVLRYFFLGLSAIAGVQAGIAHWNHPFSNSGAAARWLRSQHLDQATLIGSPDTSIAAIAEHLNRPAYFLECNCSDTFLFFSNRRDNFDPAQIPERLAEAARHIPPAEMVLILTHPLTPPQMHALTLKSLFPVPIAQFTGSEVPEEDFFLYRFSSTPIPLA